MTTHECSACGTRSPDLRSLIIRESRESQEKLEAIAEPIAAEKANPIGRCMPWMRIVKDVDKFRECQRLSEQIGRIETSKHLYTALRGALEPEDQEVYYAIGLDTQLYLRVVAEIARGARDRVMTPIQDTARYALAYALLYGCMGVAIAHCHPSGKITPSDADKDVTKAVKAACEANEILFIDHIIVGLDGYYSFKDGRGYSTPPAQQASTQQTQRAAEEAFEPRPNILAQKRIVSSRGLKKRKAR